DRLKKALQGVVMGFFLIIAATVMLFWNEGRTVKTTRMLKQAQKECVELGDVSSVNPEFNGKMVHAFGFADTEESLYDAQFQVGREKTIKLSRDVEFYQVQEHQHSETHDKVGGGQETVTTYTYDTDWVSSPINSANFSDPDYRDVNYVLLEVEDADFQAENVSFGAYKLPDMLVSQMSNWEDLAPNCSDEFVAAFDKEMHSRWDVPASKPLFQLSGNYLYVGINPNAPEIGDVRISYKYVAPATVSILAVVDGDSFKKFEDKNGYSLGSLSTGELSMEEMFTSEHKANKTTAWIIRILGLIMLVWGFNNIFDILTHLAKVLPFLGSIVGFGAKILAWIIAIPWWLIVVAIAWVWYRPVLGILLLLAAGGLIYLAVLNGKKKKAAEAAAAPAEEPAPAPAPEAPAAPEEAPKE
ncbi:MAG: TMEM43 family protein, partial [Bacteroidales bacterium]|nr:TMEM43 family protein [Bacteroidales bacterium]